jgi:hypothetical protein
MRYSRAARLAGTIVAAIICTSAHAAGQVAVIGSSIHERDAAPGASYDGSITIRNDDPAPQQVRIYLTDYRFDAEGRTEFARSGTSARSNAPWISLGAEVVVIPPGQTSVVPYRVTVPTGGTAASGSYWSVAMIEGAAAPIRGADSKSVQLVAVRRQAIQLVTHVGDTGGAAISFSNVRVVADSSGSKLLFDTENTGTRARRLVLSVDLYSPDGRLVGRFSNSRGLVYPGCSIRQSFAIGELAKGEYRVLVVADAGPDDLFAGNFTLIL